MGLPSAIRHRRLALPLTAYSQVGYNSSMKVKTSITLSEDLVRAIDRRASERHSSRSDFIEAAARAFIDQLARRDADAKDREILDREADRLNRETADVLEYQAAL